MRGCAWMLGPLAVGTFALFLVLFPALAEAQGALPLELSWQAPEHCPSAADVHAELERIAHARPGLTLEPLRAKADVTLAHKRYVLNVVTEHQGQRGERRVEARDCKTLVRTLTLILALTFGAGVEITESAAGTNDGSSKAVEPAAPPPPPPPKPKPEPARVDTGADGAEGQKRAPRTWLLFAGGGAMWGVAPSPAGALALGGELELGVFSLGLRGLGVMAATDQPSAGVEAHFDGLGAALQGCGTLTLASLTGALCGGARGMALRGRAEGDIEDASAVAPWYTLLAAAALTWPNDYWLRVRVEGALAVSLNRPRFIIQGLSEVHEVPRVVPEVGLVVLFAL